MRERLPSPGRPGTPALQSTRGHDSLQRLRVRPASFSQTSSAADVPTSPLVLPPLVGGMQQGVSDFGRASTGRGPLSSDAPPPSNRTVGIGGSEGVQKGDDEGQDGFFIGNNLFLAKGLTTAAALADEQLTGAAPSRLGPSGNGENNPLTLRRTLSCIEIDPFGKAQVRVYTREELIRELRSESVTGNTAVDVVELAFIRGDAREESQMSGALDLAPVTGGNRRTKSSKSKKRTKYGPIQSPTDAETNAAIYGCWTRRSVWSRPCTYAITSFSRFSIIISELQSSRIACLFLITSPKERDGLLSSLCNDSPECQPRRRCPLSSLRWRRFSWPLVRT